MKRGMKNLCGKVHWLVTSSGGVSKVAEKLKQLWTLLQLLKQRSMISNKSKRKSSIIWIAAMKSKIQKWLETILKSVNNNRQKKHKKLMKSVKTVWRLSRIKLKSVKKKNKRRKKEQR